MLENTSTNTGLNVEYSLQILQSLELADGVSLHLLVASNACKMPNLSQGRASLNKRSWKGAAHPSCRLFGSTNVCTLNTGDAQCRRICTQCLRTAILRRVVTNPFSTDVADWLRVIVAVSLEAGQGIVAYGSAPSGQGRALHFREGALQGTASAGWGRAGHCTGSVGAGRYVMLTVSSRMTVAGAFGGQLTFGGGHGTKQPLSFVCVVGWDCLGPRLPGFPDFRSAQGRLADAFGVADPPSPLPRPITGAWGELRGGLSFVTPGSRPPPDPKPHPFALRGGGREVATHHLTVSATSPPPFPDPEGGSTPRGDFATDPKQPCLPPRGFLSAGAVLGGGKA